LLGRELGRARWGWLGRAAGLRGLLLSFFFFFSIFHFFSII
jgi:hypothetical protein